MFPSIERVYVNERARSELGWRPRHDFGSVVERMGKGGEVAKTIVGAKPKAAILRDLSDFVEVKAV